MTDLRAVLNAALDCVVMMDHEGRIMGINPAAERTFGIAEEEARGREMADVIIPPTMREAHRRGLARLLDGGDPRILDQRIEVTAQRADGTLVPVELTITRLEVDGPPMFVGYLRDIGDRIGAEEELRRSRCSTRPRRTSRPPPRSCATWRAGCIRPCSPTAAWARHCAG